MRHLLLMCAFACAAFQASACTSAVISGKATRDGRPLLWKQRDTGTLENKLVYHTDGKFAFLSIHDLDDTSAAQAFMGSNAAGFSIINTASYNLQYPKYKGDMDEEGILMKRALATCATLADFEALLLETSGKRGVEANFGVIDAEGGAAYYEANPYTYKKFDANDSLVAPQGYLLRTNFSASGIPEKGQGYIRYQTETDLFQWGFLGDGLSVSFILNEAATCLRHSLTGVDLASGPIPETADHPAIVNFSDFIPRYSTTASLIVHGVKKGEDPRLTTLWTVLGSPLATPVLPLWVRYADQIPSQFFSAGGGPAPLNDAALRLRGRFFPLKTPEGKYYLDFARVMNRQGTGTLQKVKGLDKSILEDGGRLETLMQTRNVTANEVRQYYQGMMKGMKDYFTSCGVQF